MNIKILKRIIKSKYWKKKHFLNSYKKKFW